MGNILPRSICSCQLSGNTCTQKISIIQVHGIKGKGWKDKIFLPAFQWNIIYMCNHLLLDTEASTFRFVKSKGKERADKLRKGKLTDRHQHHLHFWIKKNSELHWRKPEVTSIHWKPRLKYTEVVNSPSMKLALGWSSLLILNESYKIILKQKLDQGNLCALKCVSGPAVGSCVWKVGSPIPDTQLPVHVCSKCRVLHGNSLSWLQPDGEGMKAHKGCQYFR